MTETTTWLCLRAGQIDALRALCEDAKPMTEEQCARLLAVLDEYTHPDACDERYRAGARDQHCVADGVCEVDTQAVVSKSDAGAYVMAWVWVPREDVEPCGDAE